MDTVVGMDESFLMARLAFEDEKTKLKNRIKALREDSAFFADERLNNEIAQLAELAFDATTPINLTDIHECVTMLEEVYGLQKPPA